MLRSFQLKTISKRFFTTFQKESIAEKMSEFGKHVHSSQDLANMKNIKHHIKEANELNDLSNITSPGATLFNCFLTFNYTHGYQLTWVIAAFTFGLFHTGNNVMLLAKHKTVMELFSKMSYVKE